MDQNYQDQESFEELDIDNILRDYKEIGQNEFERADVKPAPQDRPAKKKEKFGWQKTLMLYLHDLVFLLAAVMVIFLLCFRVVIVSGGSMKNTLHDGDYLLLLGSVFYRQPECGDVIVVSKQSFDNGAPIVKRVIATEGQTIKIDSTTNIVYVDDVPLKEDYIIGVTEYFYGDIYTLTVPDGCLFVMGDNRENSKDSRDPDIGLIDRREVLGKAIFLFLPGTEDGTTEKDYSRIGVVS